MSKEMKEAVRLLVKLVVMALFWGLAALVVSFEVAVIIALASIYANQKPL